jgi:hypothetical protein
MIDEGPHSAHEVRKGMLTALNLRAAYWDDMMLRAQKLGE